MLCACRGTMSSPIGHLGELEQLSKLNGRGVTLIDITRHPNNISLRARGQSDELILLDDDDSMNPDDIPDGFRIQASTPTALDNSLLHRRGVLVRQGIR
ncbi:unnamed protein product [Ectocarpus sp. 12 AP-2014]